jgi:hypothetical protein
MGPSYACESLILETRTAVYAASLTRLASFDKVARLSFFSEPLAASMIEFHDIPRLSIFMMAVLRFLSSGRPRYLPSIFAFVIP